jgi:ABC-2 type transport system permease protein
MSQLSGTDSGPARVAWALRDGLTIVRRNVLYLRHAPGLVILMVAAPIVLTLLFGYVFGSAIQLPGGGDYREYLVPGLFAMVAANGVIGAASVVATDAGRGVMDRFRSLPASRLAVPFGHAGADSLGGAIGFAGMALCGLAVGWRIRGGVLDAVAGFALLLLFRYAVSWVGVLLGLSVRNEEAAGQLSMLVMPIGMLANTFVPTDGMPAWLRVVADWNPVSAVAAASRDLFGNPTGTAHGAWPMEHPVLATLGWSALLLAVFVPLSVRRYRTAR